MENKLKNAPESIKEICEKFHNYLMDVLSGKQETDDKCLENYANATRNVIDVMNNKYEDSDKNKRLDEAEDFLNEAEKYKDEGLGPVLEDAISYLREEIRKLR